MTFYWPACLLTWLWGLWHGLWRQSILTLFLYVIFALIPLIIASTEAIPIRPETMGLRLSLIYVGLLYHLVAAVVWGRYGFRWLGPERLSAHPVSMLIGMTFNAGYWAFYLFYLYFLTYFTIHCSQQASQCLTY
jgi:hypothetical protein